MSIDRVLERKRDGQELTAAEIEYFVNAVTNEVATRAQAAAFLAFVFIQGMTAAETVALTLAMADSGRNNVSFVCDALPADKVRPWCLEITLKVL